LPFSRAAEVVLGCSGGWVQHLGVFARLYSLVCICLPVEVRAPPASLPRSNRMGTAR